MEKIWTTEALPPSVDEVSELSFSALKIIAYLEKSEYLNTSSGFIEDNRLSWLNNPILKINKYNKSPKKYQYSLHDKVDISEEKHDLNQLFNKSSSDACREQNLHESVDMFDDSLTYNGKFDIQLDSKCIENIESPVNSDENSDKSIILRTNKKINDYFLPVKKYNIINSHNLYETYEECNSNTKENDSTKTRKANNNADYIKDLEKSLPPKNNTNIFTKSIDKAQVKDFNYQQVSSATNFCDPISGTSICNNTKKHFLDPLPVVSSKILCCSIFSNEQSISYKISPIHNFSSYKKPLNIIKHQKGRKLNRLSIAKSRNISDNILENIVEVNKDVPALNPIIYLNENNTEDVNNILFDKNLVEIGFTICYREGFCLLNKSTSRDKCCPNGILLCAKSLENHSKLIFFSLDCFKEEKNKRILENVLGSLIRKICYEAQAFIIFLLDNIVSDNKRACYEWCILDPLVAVWLLNPDHPPQSFDELLKSISVSKFQKEDNWFSECCSYLKYQSQSMEYLYSELQKHNLWKVFLHLETKLIPILAVLETSNIMVNVEILRKMSIILQEKLNSLETEAEALVGHKFSFKSAIKIRKVLYEELKLDQASKITVKSTTRKGIKSTSESILKSLGNVHPLPNLILEYRQLWKLKSSYIDIILQHANNKQSVTAIWELCATATGRITSSSPNLQAIPKSPISIKIGEKKIEFNIRSCFIARKGYIFITADFQHIELRMFAHLAKDKVLTDLLNKDDDIFNLLTQIRLKKKIVTKEDRNQTKTVVYALLYGAGLAKLASILSVEKSKVEEITNSLFEIFPSLRNFRDKVLNEVRKSKVLKSLSGRRRIFPSINSENLAVRSATERKALNFIIQGSAADICKFTMLRIETKLREREINGRLMLQIHDELLWEVEDMSYQNMISLVKEVMADNKNYWNKEFNIEIPLPVVVSSGYNWGNMT